MLILEKASAASLEFSWISFQTSVLMLVSLQRNAFCEIVVANVVLENTIFKDATVDIVLRLWCLIIYANRIVLNQMIISFNLSVKTINKGA